LKKNKNLKYKELRKRFKIHPLGDDDRDGVRNYKDCRPWDKMRQDEDNGEGQLEVLSELQDIERELNNLLTDAHSLNRKIEEAKDNFLDTVARFEEIAGYTYDSVMPRVQEILDNR